MQPIRTLVLILTCAAGASAAFAATALPPTAGTPLPMTYGPGPAAPSRLAGSDAVSAATAEAPSPAAGSDAVSAATAGAAGAAPASPFFGFPSKTAFHKAAGWASGGLLLAAGVVGAVRAYDLMTAGHEIRDSLGMTEESQIGPQCATAIGDLYGGGRGQALRWTHVGLLAAGETLYLADAATGIGFMGPLEPGLSRSKAHRYAFFAHAFLMASEAVMGYFTSEALRTGDHETVRVLGVAHAGVGFAIPVVILGAGAVMELGR
ncbi:MAG: hypothetical protein JNG85_00545 [Spirochaetaceae bacterium]|nr:hypothetical protein [Spirochaetaceae bacterium]